jgi:membrane-associated phospholipid phosphatase
MIGDAGVDSARVRKWASGVLDASDPRFHGLVRRFLFLWMFATVVCLQITFLVVQGTGIDLDPDLMVWIQPLVGPGSLILLLLWRDRRRLDSFALDPWWLWLIVGLGMFGAWGESYFLVGQLTDPMRVRLLPPVLDRFIPFEPGFVFLYLGVYPMFLLPYFCARRPATLHRAAIGQALMLLVSYVVFLAMPVAFDRPLLPEPAPNFSAWVLQIVYGRDPPWNCLPSTHCAIALMSALAVWEADRRLGIWAVLTALGIGLSTMYTKQHYLVDVIAGFGLAGLTWWLLHWVWRNPDHVPERARQLILKDR